MPGAAGAKPNIRCEYWFSHTTMFSSGCHDQKPNCAASLAIRTRSALSARASSASLRSEISRDTTRSRTTGPSAAFRIGLTTTSHHRGAPFAVGQNC